MDQVKLRGAQRTLDRFRWIHMPRKACKLVLEAILWAFIAKS